MNLSDEVFCSCEIDFGVYLSLEFINILLCLLVEFFRVSNHFRTENFDVGQRPFSLICFLFVDIQDSFNSFYHSTENRVFVIKPGASDYCNEELRSVGIGTSIGHCQDIRFIESVFFRP